MIYITSYVITLHRSPEKTEGKKAGQGEKKGLTEKETAGIGRTDTGMTVRTAARRKRKNCDYAELGASEALVPSLCVPADRKCVFEQERQTDSVIHWDCLRMV